MLELELGRREPELGALGGLLPELGHGELLEDAASFVVDDDDRQRRAHEAGCCEAAEIVLEAHVAEKQQRGAALRERRAGGAGDQAVDTVGTALGGHDERAGAGGHEVVQRAHRQAITDDQEAALGHGFDREPHGFGLAERSAGGRHPRHGLPGGVVRAGDAGRERALLRAGLVPVERFAKRERDALRGAERARAGAGERIRVAVLGHDVQRGGGLLSEQRFEAARREWSAEAQDAVGREGGAQRGGAQEPPHGVGAGLALVVET